MTYKPFHVCFNCISHSMKMCVFSTFALYQKKQPLRTFVMETQRLIISKGGLVCGLNVEIRSIAQQ